MKVIDLLNKIANGEELPKRIKYKCDIYIIGKDKCNKDVRYIDENKDDDGYTKYLFQDWILDVILNDEVEILDEEDEFIDIEEITLNGEKMGYGVLSEWLDFSPNNNEQKICSSIEYLGVTLNNLIKNQKKIIERLNNERD